MRRLPRPVLTTRRLVPALCLLFLSKNLSAHLVNSGLGPFYDGISHFALTIEDVLPALALSLFAGQKGPRAGRLALFVLPGAWLAGGVLGLVLPLRPAPAVSAALTTASFLALGALVALDVRLKPAGVAGLAAGVGLVHGFFNGSAMATARLGAVGLLGIVASLFVLVALASALVVVLRPPWTRVAVRVAGSWIAAVGLLFLGWSLRAR